eukprot:TRINITY_DN15363_c0_g1_i1.p1 TRINITY_DN15363_c0_g1~~TRINITY_DN15363_c0_g1_i1.p1  ORF type:complete len:323 (+),score=45.20 TRINITY_DN15363_c0_g1_i1:50-1018(+)
MWRHVGTAAGGFATFAAMRVVHQTKRKSECSNEIQKGRTRLCWQQARKLGHVDDIPDELVWALRRGTCVAMVGAGLSAPAGLPGVEGLLSAVATSENIDLNLANEKANEDLDNVQFQLAKQVGKDKMCSLMQKMLLLDRPFPRDVQPVLQAFTKLPLAAVVSWNWDNLLDAQYLPTSNNSSGFESVIRSSVDVDSYERSRAPLLKMQGDLSDPTSVVLTEQDYARRNQLLADSGFLSRLFQSFTVVHIGLSLRSASAYTQEGGGSLHYAILNDVTPERRQELLERNIHAISYDSKATRWMGNEIIMEELASRIEELNYCSWL